MLIFPRIFIEGNKNPSYNYKEWWQRGKKWRRKKIAFLKGIIQYLISLSTRIYFFASSVSSVATAVVSSKMGQV